jgi:hypothetical protein
VVPGGSSAESNVMPTRKAKLVLILIPILGVAIVFSPLTTILLQEVVGALINPPFGGNN